MIMVAVVSSRIDPKISQNQNPTLTANTTTRPPLLPSEPYNALPARRPKSREVSSRYMSSSTSSTSTSKGCSTSKISRPVAMMTPTPASTIKRSQSVERRRPGTPRTDSLDVRMGNNNCSSGAAGGEMSNAQRMLITSTRSLSVSFQGESFSFQVSKAKPTPSPSNARKGTPERRKAASPIQTRGADQVENSRPMDQHRWPASLRQPNSMVRSMDCTDDTKKFTGSTGVNLNVVRALQNSMVDGSNNSNFVRSSIESILSSDFSTIDSTKPIEVNASDGQREHPVASDTESVSSGSTSESSGNAVGVGGQGLHGTRGIKVPARFCQEINNRIRRQPEPDSPGSRNVGMKGPASTKLIAPKKFGADSSASSPKGIVNSRGQFSPNHGGVVRPVSPGKFVTPLGAVLSPMRGVSPSRARNAVGGVVSSNLSHVTNTPSILSFAADIRRGKIGETRIDEVHVLRILHNRLLEWRFVNARADSALSAQRLSAEVFHYLDQSKSWSVIGEHIMHVPQMCPIFLDVSCTAIKLKAKLCKKIQIMKCLYNGRVTTAKLHESVRAKRTELQWLRQNLKLIFILKGQMVYLEELALMDQDYSRSLPGTIEALRASTLRLPVVGGARADVQKLKDAICSAVDVMQAMASSIRSLLPKVGEVHSLVDELFNVTGEERGLLAQCNDLLSTIAALQVKECSLRTHILQLNQLPSSLTTQL